MSVVGIIAEFDPFHKGHAYLIGQVRRQRPDSAVVVVMSGSFTQRGKPACLSKFDRAEMALRCGADLVVLLPLTFACASAPRFAQGAVSILTQLGIDTLAFGSETGDKEALLRIAQVLDTEAYDTALKTGLSCGISYPAAHEQAVRTVLGEDARLLQNANDLLGVEYLRMLRGSGVDALPVRRIGAAHASPDLDAPVVSATAIRGLLRDGRIEEAAALMPPETGELLKKCVLKDGTLADLERCDRAVLSSLRRMTPSDFADLPDVSEGLEHRLYRASQTVGAVKDFCPAVKTKRYTFSRLQRILLWSWLGLKQADFGEKPSFIQVLAMNEAGQGVLRNVKKTLEVPLIARPAAGKKLTGAAGRDFALECRGDDLWGLCTEQVLAGGWSLAERVRS